MSTLRRRPSSPPPLSIKMSIGKLIIDSWKTFIHDWKDSFSISIWLMAPAVLLLAVTLLERVIPDALGILPLAVFFVALCVQAWVSLQLIRDTLKRAGASVAKAPTWQVDVLTYIWTKLLNGIAVIGSLLPLVLGLAGLPIFIAFTGVSERAAAGMLFAGIVILAIPIVWLTVSLLFWPYVLVSEPEGVEHVFTQIRGRRWVSLKKTIDVLTASYELVRGRFWHTFIRLVIPGILFGTLLLASITLADSIIQWMAGPAKIAALFGTPSGATFIDVHHAAGNAYAYFLQAVGEAVFLPLFIVWQAKLFQSLRTE